MPRTEEEIDFKTFGNWLRERRKFTGLSQDEAARLADVSRVYWSQIETGERKKRPSRKTLLKIAKAVNGRSDRALEMMAYPFDDAFDASLAEKGEASQKLDKAVRDFKEILLNASSEAEAALFLMWIYREYHGRNWAKEYADGPDPLGFQTTLTRIMVMPNYERWLLVRAVLLLMEVKPETLVCFPNEPENEQFNREQRRLLKLAAGMRERQIEVTQRYERARRERAGKGGRGETGARTPDDARKR